MGEERVLRDGVEDSGKEAVVGERREGGREEEGGTFRIWLFQSCVPMRTFTVFCMRPAETTTALMVRCAVRVAMTV